MKINQILTEGAGNIGAQIKAVYKKIYDAGDDAVEFAYYDSPIFAQYWDEYEGDLDSIIAEVDPSELQIILDELTSAAEDQGMSEGSLNEFAPSDDNGDNEPDEYEILHRLAAIWWLGTEQQMVKAQRTLASMGWEIGEDEGYDDGGVFVVRANDEHGKSYISWPHEDLQLNEQGVAEGSLNEFAPSGDSSSSYYAVTANFVSEFSQQKEEEIQDLIAAGWTKQDLEQAGTLQGQAADIAHFEQVRDGFLKGLKPGFDAYLQGDTQMKDQLGEYWLDNDLPLNQDWEKIYGEPWGDDMDESVSNRALSEFSIGGDDDDTPKDDPYKYPKPEQYRRSIDFFGKFEANHFDKEDMDDATGVFKGYWYYGNKPKQIAYFKFDNPQRTGSNDPGMGWYYEPQDEGVAEAEQQKGADYRDPPEADYGPEYQDMVSRVKKLAGLGPLKTVYDPQKRVYKNVPTAVQPKK